MTLNIEDAPGNEEILALKQHARARVGLWKMRSLYFAIGFVFSSVAAAPFSNGEPLHARAGPFGRMLVYLSMALLLVAVCCVALWWGASSLLRDLETAYPPAGGPGAGDGR